MPAISLPENPSLENLRKQAKGLRKRVRDGDEQSLAQVREFHPRSDKALSGFSLSDAQLVVARSYGFTDWARLKRHVEVVERFLWTPPSGEPRSLVETFIRLACMDYESWRLSHAEKARKLLAEHLELARVDIYSAATVGDVSAARAMLAQDRALVNKKGGPLQWEPLLYACYSRLDSTDPHHSTLEVAKLLLERGADPNAGFLWNGNVPPFTALTGAFGNGEAGVNEPAHQHVYELARLLLDAGADPNDGQTLYNRHFRPEDGHFELLFSYGLGRDKGGPWFQRFGDRMQSPARMLSEELWSAARKNFMARVKLLIEHGTDVNTPSVRDGRTPYEAALRTGNLEIAAYLLEHGAKRIEPNLEDALAAACLAGNRSEALALIAKHPHAVQELGFEKRVEFLHRAVEANRPEGIRLMAELGFEVSGFMPRHEGGGLNRAATPLHNAAWMGDLEMVKLLIELGADPTVRDPNYHGTPVGWAAYNRQRHIVEYLLPFATIFDAVQCGGVERAAALLREDPSLAHAVDPKGNPLASYLHPEMERRDEMVALLRQAGSL